MKNRLTRAEYDAIVEIERMMAEGCSGMYPGGSFDSTLAEDMLDRGLLECAEMDPHPEYGAESDGGRMAYWPSGVGRFRRGMVVLALRYDPDIAFAEASP